MKALAILAVHNGFSRLHRYECYLHVKSLLRRKRQSRKDRVYYEMEKVIDAGHQDGIDGRRELSRHGASCGPWIARTEICSRRDESNTCANLDSMACLRRYYDQGLHRV
jgi:hypothetical protein